MPVADPSLADPSASPGVAAPASAPPGPLREAWTAFRRSRAGMAGLGVALLLVLAAIGAPWLAPHSPIAQDHGAIRLPPAWSPGGSAQWLLGTDGVGRDLLARLIWGARLSLSIGLQVVGVSLASGVSLGLLAGFYGGWLDAAIMRLVDMMLALPSLLLAIAIVATLGPGLGNAIVAVSIVYVPAYIRLTRAAVLTERHRDYVTASRIAGASDARLMLSTLLPNCLAPIIVQATLGFSGAVVDAAALGYLGLGAQPPTPEWGAMLAEAQQYIDSAWWVVTFPGLAILITVLAFNLIGDALRDALDPRLRR